MLIIEIPILNNIFTDALANYWKTGSFATKRFAVLYPDWRRKLLFYFISFYFLTFRGWNEVTNFELENANKWLCSKIMLKILDNTYCHKNVYTDFPVIFFTSVENIFTITYTHIYEMRLNATGFSRVFPNVRLFFPKQFCWV